MRGRGEGYTGAEALAVQLEASRLFAIAVLRAADRLLRRNAVVSIVALHAQEATLHVEFRKLRETKLEMSNHIKKYQKAP